MKTHIRLGHSPDPDDAFMFYALAKQKIDPGEFTFEHVLEDIESLNHRALRGELEVTAISIHAYPKVAHLYALLGSGGSMGDNYGPMVVARENFRIEQLSVANDLNNAVKIAVPGTMTSAFLALTLAIGEFKYEVTPFDKIISEVSAGKIDAGLIIHEGQLTYAKAGLSKILDLGEWWNKRTNGLPLPLGGNCVRRDLGTEKISRLSEKLRESIQFSLDNRAEAAEYALEFGRDLSLELADKFIGMYVNDYTIDYGSKGREAIKRFLNDGESAGLITDKYELDFA